MSYPSLTNACVIDHDGGGLKRFQCMPETISDSKGSTYGTYDILGRSSPLMGYQSGPARTVEFTAVFFAAPTQGNDSPTPADLEETKNWFLGLPYPDYSKGLMPPHRCTVFVGQSVKLRGICSYASAVMQGTSPWDLGPGFVHHIAIALKFEECLDTPLGVTERRAGDYA